MLGLITILDKEKEEKINKLESDIKTLETKNIELKYTNRNLISTITEQKNNIKTLNSMINELESSNETVVSLEKLNEEHKNLLEKYESLQLRYKKSQEEITSLKELIPQTKSSGGLFSRFLKKNNTDNEEEDKVD